MSETKLSTPCYVFDIPALIKRAKSISAALGKIKLCYAVKANPTVIADIFEYVDCLEVCSMGEYRICERAGVPAEKIVLSGVYKEESDIRSVISKCGDKPLYTVESPSQFDLLSKLAVETKLTLSVCLRLSSGNQFGMDKATLLECAAKQGENLKVRGIQYYSGTQKKPEKMRDEIALLIQFCRELERTCGYPCERIEYGPGLSVSYFQSDAPVDERAVLELIKEEFGAYYGEVVIESGRFLVADCGTYYTSAVDLKQTGNANYCIVDGGINHLNYYGQTMAMKLPFVDKISADGICTYDMKNYTVCGSLCTTADVLVRSLPIGGLKVGDILAFHKAGAYSVTEGVYLFLSRDMPRIYKVNRDGETVLWRDVVHTDRFNG